MAHVPVLLKETIELLNPQPGEFIVDGTLDGGGHARAILPLLAPKGFFLGLDLDEKLARRTAKELKQKSVEIKVVHSNYADLPELLVQNGWSPVDGLLLDLGYSSEQIENSGRGFSFERDEPLLMTYDDSLEPVRDFLPGLPEAKLASILRELGGERMAGRVARAIKRAGPIQTTGQLAEIVRGALPRNYERGRINPATRTFQALRIFANKEMENLARILAAVPRIMAPGGRAAVISFHSLEDRIVKQSFRSLSNAGTAELLNKKPIGPTAEEILENPRSRSAKLRVLKINSTKKQK